MSQRQLEIGADGGELAGQLECREAGAEVLADLALDLAHMRDQIVEAVPYWLSSFAAVLGPTLSMPGMLSEVSPTSAR